MQIKENKQVNGTRNKTIDFFDNDKNLHTVAIERP